MAKILVIEDEPVLRLRLRHQLEKAGYAVREAPNGAVGLALVQEEPPDVVVTDVYMPEKDGIEVLRAIRSSWTNIKVIVMTGGSVMDPMGAKAINVAKQLGADRILTKGFNTQTLLGDIEDLLRADERRRFPRFDVECEFALFRDEVFLGNAIGCGLSEAGCAMKTPVLMMKGDYVAVELYLPDDREQIAPLNIEVAVVRWAAEEKYGLEFIKLPHEDHQRLGRYLMSLQTTRPRSKAPIQVSSHRADPKVE